MIEFTDWSESHQGLENVRGIVHRNLGRMRRNPEPHASWTWILRRCRRDTHFRRLMHIVQPDRLTDACHNPLLTSKSSQGLPNSVNPALAHVLAGASSIDCIDRSEMLTATQSSLFRARFRDDPRARAALGDNDTLNW